MWDYEIFIDFLSHEIFLTATYLFDDWFIACKKCNISRCQNILSLMRPSRRLQIMIAL